MGLGESGRGFPGGERHQLFFWILDRQGGTPSMSFSLSGCTVPGTCLVTTVGQTCAGPGRSGWPVMLVSLQDWFPGAAQAPRPSGCPFSARSPSALPTASGCPSMSCVGSGLGLPVPQPASLLAGHPGILSTCLTDICLAIPGTPVWPE